jgi:predicted MFS family arabinose efflux permease
MELFSTAWWSALMAIILIDLVLAGDNAIVIALAARNLPPHLQKKAIIWGTVGAIAVRSVMTVGVVWLLKVPGLMLVGGLALSIPMALLAAFAPSVEILVLARIGGGIAAGMAFPTTLSIVVALFKGQSQTKAIAMWTGIGCGASALGPAIAGYLLEHYGWGSAYSLTVPIAVVALVLAILVIPKKLGEETRPVDHLGGVLSVRLGVMRVLMLGAVLSAASNLLFAWLGTRGHDLQALIWVVSADNLAGGLASSAFIAYLSGLTQVRYSATQYALFSSMMLLLPKWLAGFSGVVVDSVGYSTFFVGTALLGVPVLLLVALAARVR